MLVSDLTSFPFNFWHFWSGIRCLSWCRFWFGLSIWSISWFGKFSLKKIKVKKLRKPNQVWVCLDETRFWFFWNYTYRNCRILDKNVFSYRSMQLNMSQVFSSNQCVLKLYDFFFHLFRFNLNSVHQNCNLNISVLEILVWQLVLFWIC